jgi:hypothetical protein
MWVDAKVNKGIRDEGGRRESLLCELAFLLFRYPSRRHSNRILHSTPMNGVVLLGDESTGEPSHDQLLPIIGLGCEKSTDGQILMSGPAIP